MAPSYENMQTTPNLGSYKPGLQFNQGAQTLHTTHDEDFKFKAPQSHCQRCRLDPYQAPQLNVRTPDHPVGMCPPQRCFVQSSLRLVTPHVLIVSTTLLGAQAFSLAYPILMVEPKGSTNFFVMSCLETDFTPRPVVLQLGPACMHMLSDALDLITRLPFEFFRLAEACTQQATGASDVMSRRSSNEVHIQCGSDEGQEQDINSHRLSVMNDLKLSKTHRAAVIAAGSFRSGPEHHVSMTIPYRLCALVTHMQT